MSLPEPGDLDWGAPLNNAIQTAQSEAAEAKAEAEAARNDAAYAKNIVNSIGDVSEAVSTATEAAESATSSATTATGAASSAAAQASVASAARIAAEDARDAAQAVGSTNDTIIAGRITDSGSATAAALTASYAGAAGRLMRPADAEKINARLRSGQGVKYAALGDSTEAGVGFGGANSYGEAQRLAFYAGPTVLALAMIRADPNFVEPDPTVYAVSAPSATISVPFHNLVKSAAPTVAYTATQVTPDPLDRLTVYFIARTADTAVKFDLTVDGTTTTVQTYVAPLTYVGSIDVSLRLAKVTVDCSADAEVSWTIDNLVREDGTGSDGTLYYLGATRGEGVDFMNYAVSSTTLLNASAANVSRGITTDDRIQAAIDMEADLVSMGWGTNDSKPGVSTVAAFKTDLAGRIAEIRAALPNAVIFLTNDPPGLASPYDGNPAYNQAVREVALSAGVSCIDVESLMTGQTDLYADDVHPSAKGYQAIGAATARAFGMGPAFAAVKAVAAGATGPEVTYGTGTPEGTVTGGSGDLYTRVDGSGVPTLYQKRTASGNTGWHIISGHRVSAVTGNTTPNRDTTTIIRATISANVTFGAPTNGYAGDELTIYITQSGSGSYTATWNAKYKFAGNTAPTLSTAVGAIDCFQFQYDATADRWREVSRTLGSA